MEDAHRRVACIECRQQKVRCTGSSDMDSACERCTRKGIQCVVDSEYKRTAKRQKIAQLEQEMATMRRQLQQNRVAAGVPVIDVQEDVKKDTGDRVTPNDKLPAAVYKSIPRAVQLPLADVLASVVDWSCSPKVMDDVYLTPETVQELFKEYLVHYHPIMPVVNISQGIEHIFKQSAALFWTIMATASRRYNDGELVTKLSGVQKTMLAEVAVSPVIRESSGQKFNFANVYTVQAFIIASLWPLPTSSINADSSWNTCGMAIFTAIRTGLHLPGYHKEFGRINQAGASTARATNREQCITWLAANTVCQSVSNMYGYPSVASFNHATVVQGLDIPLGIYVGFMIGLIAHDIETSLNSNTRDPITLSNIGERLSLIRILSVRLDDLERDFSASFNDETWFDLLATRVRLYMYYFLDNSSLSAFQLQRSYVSAYNACLALMDFVQQAIARNEDYLRYAPLVNVQLLWQAGTVVCRLYYSRWAQNLDKRKARDLYLKTVRSINNASILEHDVAFRAAEIMQQMWSAFSSMASGTCERIWSSKVDIWTRMAASVFFDSLWTLREECEILSHAPTVLTHKGTGNSLSNGSHRPLTSGVNGHIHTNPATQTVVKEESKKSLNVELHGTPPTNKASPYMLSTETSPEMLSTPENLHYDWDATTAWKDVNMMMEEFGFQFDGN